MYDLIDVFSIESLNVDYIGLQLNISGSKKKLQNFIEELLSLEFQLIKVKYNKITRREEFERYMFKSTDKKTTYSATLSVHTQSLNSKLFISFKGNTGGFFYKLIKSNKLDLFNPEFPEMKLARFDLNFIRKNKLNDPSIETYFYKCRLKIPSTTTYRSEHKPNGKNILRICKRNGPRYHRIYETVEGDLKFELELKQRSNDKLLPLLQEKIKKKLFFDFEKDFSNIFFKQWYRYIACDSDFTDWFINRLRENKADSKITGFLLTYLQTIETYLETKKSSEINIDKLEINFYRFFQLMSYLKLKKHDSKKIVLNDEVYRLLEFSLFDFMMYCSNSLTDNQLRYQKNSFKEFIYNLRELPVINENFTDGTFQSSVLFPTYKIFYKHEIGLIVSLAVLEKVFTHKFQFNLDKHFLCYSCKNDRIVKFSLMKSLATNNYIKTYQLEDLFHSPSISFKTRNIRIEKLGVALKNLVNHKIIEDSFKVTYRKKIDNENAVDIGSFDVMLDNLMKYETITFYEKFDKTNLIRSEDFYKL